MLLGGPIPNSLGAGAGNQTFIPHGLVAFMPGGLVFPDVFMEVCLDAVLHPTVVANAELLQALPIDSRLDQAFSTSAVLHDTIVTDSEILQDLQVDAIVEEC